MIKSNARPRRLRCCSLSSYALSSSSFSSLLSFLLLLVVVVVLLLLLLLLVLLLLLLVLILLLLLLLLLVVVLLLLILLILLTLLVRLLVLLLQTFRFGVGPGHLGPSEGDGSGRYICVPHPDRLVTGAGLALRFYRLSLRFHCIIDFFCAVLTVDRCLQPGRTRSMWRASS